MSERTRSAGSMTRAMSAKNLKETTVRSLRIGVLQDESSLEEYTVRTQDTVSAGSTERATLPVRTVGFPTHIDLFVFRNGKWFLRIERTFEGRIAHKETVRSLEALMQSEDVTVQGDTFLLALDEQSRGKITLKGVTFLFQFVVAPAAMPKPQLPSSLRAGIGRDLDWRYNLCLASFLSLGLGALSWMELGYDPIIDDNADLIEFVSRRVRMSPMEDNVAEPEPVQESTAPTTASNNTSEAAATRPANRPTQHTSTQHTPAHTPSVADAERQAQRALDAAQRFTQNMARFDPLTGITGGPGSAVDQLHSQALMEGTAEDLQHVSGISTTRTPGIQRGNVNHAPTVPNAQTLGRNTTIATTNTPTTGALREPTGPRSQLAMSVHSEEPEHATCDEDASSVAHTFRQHISAIRLCYEAAIRSNPTLHGRLTVRFTLATSGRTTSVNVTGVDESLNQCIERRISSWVFPRLGCEAASFVFPVTVDPSQ
jgi:hypothetical protein